MTINETTTSKRLLECIESLEERRRMCNIPGTLELRDICVDIPPFSFAMRKNISRMNICEYVGLLLFFEAHLVYSTLYSTEQNSNINMLVFTFAIIVLHMFK